MSRFDSRSLRVAGTLLLTVAAIYPAWAIPTGAKGADRSKSKTLQTKSTKPARETVKPNALLESREASELAEIEKSGQFTGVIIVTTGFKVERSMSPRLRRADGSDIWTGGNASPDYAIEHGIVSYAKSLDEAMKLERVGSRPLIITATGRHENAYRSDPVLSEADEQQILDIDKKVGLLKKFRVVFVID